MTAPASLHHGSFYILLSSLFFSFSIFSFSPSSFHLSLHPIPSFSFSSTYPFSSLIHPASIYFLSLASQYTLLFFLILHLVFLFSFSFILFFQFFLFLSLHFFLLIPLLFFLYFQCPAFSSLSFSSYFYFSFPLHSFMILLFILLQFTFPPLPIIILSLFFFFCTYSSSTLFSPSLSLSFIPSLSSPSCCWFSSYHPKPFDLLFYLHLSTKIAYFFQCCWYMYLDDCAR